MASKAYADGWFFICVFNFFNPQLSRMMGLDAIARKRNWHIQACSKDDTENAKQGLSKLVSFINPDTETSEQNRLWAQKTTNMCVISTLI